MHRRLLPGPGQHDFSLLKLPLLSLFQGVLHDELLIQALVIKLVFVVEPAPLEGQLALRLLHLLHYLLLVEELEEILSEGEAQALQHAFTSRGFFFAS